MKKPVIYIDGEAGTTGLQVQARLAARDDIELLLLADQRRDIAARKQALNQADLVILCLPDDQAVEAVAMIENSEVKVIDASSAHRTHPDWVYGFPEYQPGHDQIIRDAKRVSNPGCYAITSVAMIYPLVKHGLIPPDYPLSLNGVSGYSGGGKKMIDEFEADGEMFHHYGLGLNHKHLPEITKWGGLSTSPIFMPSVAPFKQGMSVTMPLALDLLKIGFNTIYNVYVSHYQPLGQVIVGRPEASMQISRLKPQLAANQDELTIHLFHNPDFTRCVVIGILDNLGKGASGQAVQNMNLIFGLEENLGLNLKAGVF